MPASGTVRSVADVPDHDELLDAIEQQDDRREAWMAVVITAVALAVMLVASLLVIVSAGRF